MAGRENETEESTQPLLQLYGARTEPSSLLRVHGMVHGAQGEVSVQYMLDSGASGCGFIDTRFAQECGALIRPSSRTIVLADGTQVRAAGEVQIRYSLDGRTCGTGTGSSCNEPVEFSSTFICTNIAPHQIILGLGWLEEHIVTVGFRERSIELTDGVGQRRCVRSTGRYDYRDRSIPVEAEQPLELKSISQRAATKLIRRKQVEELYLVLIQPKTETEAGTGTETEAGAGLKGGEDPQIAALLTEFSDVLAPPKPGVPMSRGVEHSIELVPGARPPPCRPLRHQSEKDAQVMREYVEAGLASGVIRPSVSPYGSIALIVKKKDGTPRVVIDYRPLNDLTVKNKYPLPLISEMLDKLVHAKVFTILDLVQGFHQIALRPEDRAKTAFRTRSGSYEFLVLPMGLANSPGTFQQLMNSTFGDVLDRFVLCFLDDILIFSRTREEHMLHLRTVLERLRAQQLHVKPSKCQFAQESVPFLGHIVGADGIRVSGDKVQAIQDWPVPTNTTEVRGFLGLSNFYRRFVRNYSRVALPLTELTRDTAGWRWGEEEQTSFDALKQALMSPPVLIVPDQSLPFVLSTDACKYAIGGVLEQDRGEGNGLQPVAFFSAKLSPAERNYDVREIEFYAIVRSCQEFRPYLHSEIPFTLRTDHSSLTYHRTMPHLTGRLARWMERMADFHYNLIHIPGKLNSVADALSRRADHNYGDETSGTSVEVNVVGAVRPQAHRHGGRKGRRRVVHTPESDEQRQRNRDAAEQVMIKDETVPAPNRNGAIITPTQRCTAECNQGGQCAQRTKIGHMCWSHATRDLGIRVRKSGIPSAGRGLFVARPGGLMKGHSIPYTGDELELHTDEDGGAYVLELKKGLGIDAARQNSGLGRWINDPRGAKAVNGRRRVHNCVFVISDANRRIASIRTIRAVKQGTELLVRYGSEYWSYVAAPKAVHARVRKNRKGRKRNKQHRGYAHAHAHAHAPGGTNQLALNRVETRASTGADASTTINNKTPEQQPMPPPTPTHTTTTQEEEGRSTQASVSDTSSIIGAARRAAEGDSEYARLVASPTEGDRICRGLIFTREGRLRVPEDDALRTRLLAAHHDAPTGGHAGRDIMYRSMHQRYTWKGMATDVERYVQTCDNCQRNKYSNQLKPGLLMPLPIPDDPVSWWTTDSVSGLPRTKAGYDCIQVFVDRRTKLKRFAPMKKTDGSAELANVTLRTIISSFGMPRSIVSDRDTRMTALYWRELQRVLGTEVHMSTSYHPQSDGQSEREISTLVTGLRSYVNRLGSDWDTYLPVFELALNARVQASTGVSPFYLVYGREARLPMDDALDEVRPVSVPAVSDRAERIRLAMDAARTTGERAQERMKRLADRQRRVMELQVGDQVLLSTEGLHMRSGSHKLTGRYIGPFRVIGGVNENAVTLDLPPLLGALHPTVNVSRLKVYRDGRSAFPTRPIRFPQPPAVVSDTNGEQQWEVEGISAQRGVGVRRELLVRWKGYGPEHDEWKRRSELLVSAPEVVAEHDGRQQGRMPEEA